MTDTAPTDNHSNGTAPATAAPIQQTAVSTQQYVTTTTVPAAYTQQTLLYAQQQQAYGVQPGVSQLLGIAPQASAYQTSYTTPGVYPSLYNNYAGYPQAGVAGVAGAAGGGTAPKIAGPGDKQKPKKRKRKKQYSDEESPSEEEEEEFFDEPEPEPILEPSENWIACDDPSCGKWRRIPREYDTTKHPTFEQMQTAPWFCHMNPDTTRNQCSVAEESFDEAQEVIIPPKKVKKPRGPRKPKVPKPEPEPEPEPEDEEEDAGEKDDERDEDYNGESDGEQSAAISAEEEEI